MAEKDNDGLRVVFSGAQQEIFLAKVSRSLDLNNRELAALLGVHHRTLSDWRRGRYLMSLSAALVLSRQSGVALPREIKTRDRYWYTKKGARAGWSVIQKKYGRVPVNETHRRRRWEQWWEREGRFREHPIIGVSTSVKHPRFSERLAEFTGVVMGDGGITPFQVVVTLDSKTDKKYSLNVQNLIKELFEVPVVRRVHINQRVATLTVSRVELVRFCRDRLGLKVGHKLKQGLDIPDWIWKKRAYLRGCIRGLMDTDGSIFNECHKVSGKKYCYPRLCFSSASPALCSSVVKGLQKFGLNPVVRSQRKVQLENRADILDYFKLIGTNNPKHQKRFDDFMGGVEQLVALRS